MPIFIKGSRKECGNYRGISLPSIAGKIVACMILSRLNDKITPHVPETQCGFRNNQSTMDMVFSLRQIQEKCTKPNLETYAVFIDFTKAFDTVSRERLWLVLRRFECTEKIINLLKAIHNGIQSKVVSGGEASDQFTVTNCVNQGYLLAPTLFSLYLTAMLDVAFRNAKEGSTYKPEAIQTYSMFHISSRKLALPSV